MGNCRCTAPLFWTTALGSECSVSRPFRFIPEEIAPPPLVSSKQEAGWTSEKVWKLWSRKLLLAPTGNRTPAIPREKKGRRKKTATDLLNPERDGSNE
jgi:hypothetical protein